MRRTFLLLLAATLFPALGASAFSLVKSDRENDELKGPVKSVNEYMLSKAAYFHADTVEKYRSLGRPLPEYEKVLFNHVFYDRQGRKTEEIDPVLESKTVNRYSSLKGSMIAEVSDNFFKGELSRHYVFSLGSDGIPVSAKATDGDGQIIFTETFTATRDGDKTNVRCDHVKADGTLSVQNLVLRPDRSILSLTLDNGTKKQMFVLNEEELPVELTVSSPYESTHMVFDYSPDKRNAFSVAPDGSRKLNMETTLDRNGNPVSIFKYDENGTLVEATSFIYIYDSHGNWTKRSKFVNSNSASEIMEREITYY